MRTLAAVLCLLLAAPLTAEAQQPGTPLVFGRLVGLWAVEVTGLDPDGEAATRKGREDCRWTAGETAVFCEARFDAFGVPLHEARLYMVQAATGTITRTTTNSHGLVITARCQTPQPGLLLCAAEVPTGDPNRSTHLRDSSRIQTGRQIQEWEASRDRQKTWSAVGRGEKTRLPPPSSD